MKTVAVMLGMLSGSFLVVTVTRLFMPREPDQNVEGGGGASV